MEAGKEAGWRQAEGRKEEPERMQEEIRKDAAWMQKVGMNGGRK